MFKINGTKYSLCSSADPKHKCQPKELQNTQSRNKTKIMKKKFLFNCQLCNRTVTKIKNLQSTAHRSMKKHTIAQTVTYIR